MHFPSPNASRMNFFALWSKMHRHTFIHCIVVGERGPSHVGHRRNEYFEPYCDSDMMLFWLEKGKTNESSNYSYCIVAGEVLSIVNVEFQILKNPL